MINYNPKAGQFATQPDNVARRQLIMDYLEEREALVDRFYTNAYGYSMEAN